MALAGESEQFVVHRKRVTARQLGGLSDPHLAKVSGDGRAYVRDVLQTRDLPHGLRRWFALFRHRQLPSPVHRLNRRFPLQRRTLVGVIFLIKQFNRAMAARVPLLC